MGLSDAFPWQCAALLMFFATLLSGIATGIPAWSTTISEPAGTQQFTEYGPWETCQTDLNQASPIRRCTQALVDSNATCGGTYLAMRVITPMAVVFAFLCLICFCVLLKKASFPIAAAAICLGLLAFAFMVTAFALWVTIAEDNECNNRQGPIGNYRASFMMMVTAAAFTLGALLLACFGLLWLLKNKAPKEVEEQVEIIEYVDAPIQSYPAYVSQPAYPSVYAPVANPPVASYPPTYFGGAAAPSVYSAAPSNPYVTFI